MVTNTALSPESSAFHMRPGTPEDYSTILDIQRRAYTLKEVPLYGTDLPPLGETELSVEQEVSSGKQLWVGELDSRVVASMRVKVLEDGTVYGCRLSVDPECQGRGFGQKMVAGIEEIFPDAPAFVLDCGEKSDENHHIYSKMGYSLTGESFQVPNGPLVRVMRKERA